MWAYQINPHDIHDYDAVNENILLDLNIGGRVRKVLEHPDRNGYMYLMDRTTGEVLSAQTFGYVNTRFGVDVKTGALKLNPNKQTGFNTVRDAAPLPQALRTGRRRHFPPRRASSTYRTTISAMKTRVSRRTTSRELPLWA